MFQILIPSIVALLGFNALVWIIYGFIRPKDQGEDAKEISKVLRKVSGILSLISFSIFYWYVANIASVNEMPRTSIDRSALERGKTNFEKRMKQDTAIINNKK